MDQTDLRSPHFTRVAMPLDGLAWLHQQIQQVLVGLREGRQGKAKG
ncbi:MAG: hypothetical protein OEV08_10075 [Nitrospira sp.]|nr:hypothetical protein [Nitrospira sp.]